MTKAKSTDRPANAGAQPKTDAATSETKAKRPRGKAAQADKGSATATAAVAPIERPAETTITHAIPDATSKPPRQTKAALLRARLAGPGGVSLATLIEATGWQAHTLRAYLSGLRKEGLTLTRRWEADDTIYAIEPDGSWASGAAKDSTPGDPPKAAAGSMADTPSEAVPAVQGSGHSVNDADSAPATSESNA